MKICRKCGEEKDESEFGKRGHLTHSYCIVCLRARSLQYYYKNRDKQIARLKKWKADNKERVKEERRAYYEAHPEKRAEAKKRYRKRHPEKVREWRRAYRATPRGRAMRAIRRRLEKAIRIKKSLEKIDALLGCSPKQLVAHIEAQFEPGMTWENHGTHGWHIDHIVPLNTFDLTDNEQIKQATHYTNLRPLWAKENISRPYDGSDI